MAEAEDYSNVQFDEYDGYAYWCSSIDKNTCYLKCKEFKNKQCPGFGKREYRFILTVGHNHPPNPDLLIVQMFKNELYGAVISSFRDFRLIYDETCLLHPHGAALVPFRFIERSMLRWRRQYCPAIPRSLVEYTNIVNMERWRCFREYSGGSLTVACIRAEDGSNITVFADVEFLRLLREVELYIDATFKVCPRRPSIRQFLTIMARIGDTVIPITWALMESKSMQAYLALFRYFSLRLAPTVAPTVIMTDFELALTLAFSAVYRNATIVHCFFHYCQALTKRWKTQGQAHMRRLNESKHMKIFFRKLMALALLPAENISEAFHWLVANATADVLEYFESLLQYFSIWWLTRVTPQRFSVFSLTHRTNNAIEAYHRILHQRMGDHPSIWRFTDHIRIVQNATRIEYVSLTRGHPIRRNLSNRYVVQEAIVQRAWELLRHNALDVPRFLSCANHFLRGFGNTLLITTTSQVDYFVYAQNHDIALRPNGEEIQNIFFEDLVGIPILDYPVDAEGNMEIMLLRDVNASKCPVCNRSIADILCLPCRHWMACRNCTQDMIATAARENAQIRCRICINVVIVFQKMHVT